MSIKRYVAIVMMVLVAMVAGVTNVEAQYLRERSLVREGNRNFSRNNYLTSFNRYNSALEHDSTNYEALYNRANAHHQLRRTTPEDSTLVAEHTYRLYEDIAADTLLTATQRAEVLRNLGESLFADEKYEAALNSFRESLRLNPDDKETKYDYVLTKRIVDQKRQQQQQNQNQDNQQQQNDNNQQNNNQQNQDNNQNQDQNQQQNPEQDNQQGDNEQDNGGDEGENEPQQQPEGGERPQQLNSDQERMLDAIQAEEDKTQDKLKDKKKALIIPGKKNW
ncbi:MAG: tetratricopeptide repeat protein [Alistipes sp.]|nr:tetratricopeptide repeat protein [Alistipes sp.]